jgi:glycine C-acetyltransferase/8-amino-7-oxononanoate synthase
VPEGTSRLRLAVMASHSRAELREAAQVLGRAALQAGWRPGEGVPVAAAREAAERPSDGPFDIERQAA